MTLQRCFGGMTFQALKSSSSIFSPLSKTVALSSPSLSRRRCHRRPDRLFLARALSVAAVQSTPTIPMREENAAKPKWNAAVDFKWIRDNRDAVAANIKSRNSNANLELVLQLYERVSDLQKIAGS